MERVAPILNAHQNNPLKQFIGTHVLEGNIAMSIFKKVQKGRISNTLKLESFTLLSDFKDSEPWKSIREAYDSKDANDRLLATLLNGIFTEGKSRFLLGVNPLTAYLVADPNAERKTMDGQSFKKFVAIWCEAEVLRQTQAPTTKGKNAGGYEIIHPELLALMNHLFGEENIENQKARFNEGHGKTRSFFSSGPHPSQLASQFSSQSSSTVTVSDTVVENEIGTDDDSVSVLRTDMGDKSHPNSQEHQGKSTGHKEDASVSMENSSVSSTSPEGQKSGALRPQCSGLSPRDVAEAWDAVDALHKKVRVMFPPELKADFDRIYAVICNTNTSHEAQRFWLEIYARQYHCKSNLSQKRRLRLEEQEEWLRNQDRDEPSLDFEDLLEGNSQNEDELYDSKGDRLFLDGDENEESEDENESA